MSDYSSDSKNTTTLADDSKNSTTYINDEFEGQVTAVFDRAKFDKSKFDETLSEDIKTEYQNDTKN